MSGEYVGDAVLVALDLDDGVRGRDYGVNSLVCPQRLDVGCDDRLRDQRTYGVMKQDVALVGAESSKCGCRSLVARLGTFQYLGDLDVVAVLDDGPNLIQEPGCHHHHDFIDERGLVHRGDGVLDDRLASNLDQLLGNVQADASASAPSQDHGNVAQSGHRLTLPRSGRLPTLAEAPFWLCSRGAPGSWCRRRSSRNALVPFARCPPVRVSLIVPPITSGRLPTLAEQVASGAIKHCSIKMWKSRMHAQSECCGPGVQPRRLLHTVHRFPDIAEPPV